MSTTRSMRSLPPTYAPSLLLSHGKKYRDQTFCTLFDEGSHVRSIPEMRGMRLINSCYGWLLLQSYYSSECYLFNPADLTKIDLPPLTETTFHAGGLTSAPTDPNCSVVFLSQRKKSIMFCRIGGTKWVENDLALTKKNRRLLDMDGWCDVISCNGKIYVRFDYAIAVINVYDTFGTANIYEEKSLRQSTPCNCCYHEYLVESSGEVFKVVGICFRDLGLTIQKCDVYKWDISTMDWVRAESLGDRIFLLGQTSVSLITTGLGVKGNRIYFTLPASPLLYMFDMDDGTVTTRLFSPQNLSSWRGPFWVLPNCKLQVFPIFCSGKSLSKDRKDNGFWNNLPSELLELIISSLTLADCMRFRLTSKNWVHTIPPLRTDLPIVESDAPWLISFPNINKGLCTFYHPIYGDAYTMNFPELEGAYIHEAKYGWLLMSRDHTNMFFFHPLTKDIINIPDLVELYDFAGISFSSPPTSSDCVVIGYERSTIRYKGCIFIYPLKDNELKGEEAIWYVYTNESKTDYEFMASDCNPIFYGGVFYFLSKDGRIGIFDARDEEDELESEDDQEREDDPILQVLPLSDIFYPEDEPKSEENPIWQVLPVSPIFTYKKRGDFKTAVRGFLVECDGEILSIFVDFRSTPIWIYRLDQSEKGMKWMRVESLGDKVLFLSSAGSALLRSGLKGIENRIYFPKFHEKSNVYYSLKTGKYHCCECMYCGGSCKSFCEPTNCTWMLFPN